VSAHTLAELLEQVQAIATQARELDVALGRLYRAKEQRGPLGEHLQDAYAGVLDAYHLVNQAKGVLRVVAGDVRKAQNGEALALEVRDLGWSWGGRDDDKGWRAWRPGRPGTNERAMVFAFGHSREQLLAVIAATDATSCAEVASHG
jgi:hypothetical protein